MHENFVLVGENTDKVFNLIMEFINVKEVLKTEKKLNKRSVAGLHHLYTLARIVKDFIVSPGFDENQIKKALLSAYNQEDGVANFIEYYEILKKEKEFGFKNLNQIIKQKSTAN